MLQNKLSEDSRIEALKSLYVFLMKKLFFCLLNGLLLFQLYTLINNLDIFFCPFDLDQCFYYNFLLVFHFYTTSVTPYWRQLSFFVFKLSLIYNLISQFFVCCWKANGVKKFNKKKISYIFNAINQLSNIFEY